MGAPIELAGRRVAVVGLGKSGLAAARFCAERGAEVTGCDDRNEAALAGALAPLQDYLTAGKMELALGGIATDVLSEANLIVLSPGVPPTLPALCDARAAGIPITGEIELASRFIAAPIVGITGTNGKSTVTSLCGAMAAATGRPSFCGGNLGTPLIDAIGTPAATAAGIVVVELSSYQLETAETLTCDAAAVLNLTPDHLDRYPSLATYGDAKGRIFANMPPLATRVFNADDPQVQALWERRLGAGQVGYAFSMRGPVPPQLFMERALRLGGWRAGSELVLSGVAGGLQARAHGGELPIERYPIAELNLVGQHNLANVLAALLLMRGSDLCTPEQARAALRSFHALPHRMQLVAEASGIRFYDDSKGTNVDAVVAGLWGFPQPLVLIAGGRDKGGSYAPLRAVLEGNRTRGVIVIGEAAPLLQSALEGCDFPVAPAPTMEAAVQQAAALCRAGDAVVLSPACSSFDMFRDYAHRAEVFTAAALALPGARRIGGAHEPATPGSQP